MNKENPFSSSRYDVFPEFRWTGKIEIPNQANCMLCLEVFCFCFFLFLFRFFF